MIIVSGKIQLKPGERAAFLRSSRKAMKLARKAPGCADFVVAADPLQQDRVNVYEEWRSRAELLAFRGSGPNDDLRTQILRIDVHERRAG